MTLIVCDKQNSTSRGGGTQVEKEVHQIIFRDENQGPLEGYVLSATESVRNCFSDFNIAIWGVEDARAFLRSNYPRAVLRAFDCMRPYAYKADLFKFCLLQALGGWYVDAGVKFIKSPTTFLESEFEPSAVLFRSTGPWDAPWNCSIALIYAVRGQKFFDAAIQEVISNCKREHYGANPLCPTMTAFGRALATHNIHEGVVIGEVVDIEGEDYQRGFSLNSDGVIAARKPRAGNQIEVGDVNYLGITGGNNYVDLWSKREVYQKRRLL